jgi:DNA polymerase zeta
MQRGQHALANHSADRFPHYSPWTLTEWFRSKYPEHVTRLLNYFIDKVNMYVEMMDQAEIVTKNAEFARVFGVDFNSVMSRGSQFKVESFMFRIAKPESFVLISPTREEVSADKGFQWMILTSLINTGRKTERS